MQVQTKIMQASSLRLKTFMQVQKIFMQVCLKTVMRVQKHLCKYDETIYASSEKNYASTI